MSRPRKQTMTIIDLSSSRRKNHPDTVLITKTGIYIGPEIAKKLSLRKGDYITLAEEKGVYYLGKRPANVFGGGRLSAHEKTPNRPFVQLKNHNLKKGRYTLGQEVDVQMINEFDKTVTAFCYELQPE